MYSPNPLHPNYFQQRVMHTAKKLLRYIFLLKTLFKKRKKEKETWEDNSWVSKTIFFIIILNRNRFQIRG